MRFESAARRSRNTRLACFAAAWLLFVVGGCSSEHVGDRPNVLFILAEDQGAHLGALGTAGLETPQIDDLAGRGMLFTQAFTVYPVCSASKASLYTGRHPHEHGLRGNTANLFKPADEVTPEDRTHPLYDRLRVGDGHPTLIELLHAAGVTTAITHKLHVLPNEKFPFDRYQRRTTAEDVAGLIEALSSDAPWFLMLNLKGAHRPFRNSDETRIGVNPDEVSLPGHLPDTPAVRQDWAEYLDAIERTDALVGVALRALEATGQREHTLIIYTSDHGPAFQRGKMSLHDLGVRVPLVVAGPGVQAGLRSDALVSSIDLMPSLLDVFSLPSVPSLEGRSLWPLLEGRLDSEPPGHVFAEIDHQVDRHEHGMRERSAFDGQYRLIWRDDGRKPRSVNADIWWWKQWRNRTYQETVNRRAEFPDAFRWLRWIDTGRLQGVAPTRELYDLAADPHELVNLAGESEHHATLQRLETALRSHARTTGDDAFDGMADRVSGRNGKNGNIR